MKNCLKILTTLLLVLIFANSYAQDLKYTDLIRGEKKPKMPWSGFQTYVSKDGTLYKAGDIIKIGFPSTDKAFAFVLVGLRTEGYNKSYSGKEVKIKWFRVDGFKNEGYQAVAVCKGALLETFDIQLENAIQTREIKTSRMTSDEALFELKKAKDKLDLGLITQAKYDSLKTEYAKIIK